MPSGHLTEPDASSARRLIEELVYRWAVARDSDDWDALGDCFHRDADIHVSWISATGQEFVRRSQAMAMARKPGRHMKHIISNPWIEVNGDRGFSRSNASLLIRDCIGDAWFDIESHIRFFDRVEARNGVWRLVERTAVYDKDRIDFLDGAPWSNAPWNASTVPAYPAEARHLCWWLDSRGFKPLPDLIRVYSDEEGHLRDACRRWMNHDA